MIIKLKYRYYTSKPICKETRRDGVFDFDTDIYRDDPDNYENVVGDYVQEKCAGYLALHVEKVT